DPVEVSPSTVAALGDEDAPITIVEFSDYQCPFCRRHVDETMPTLLAEMIETGRVRYEFKDFPLDNIHPQARLAAEAARCAGDQEAYWEMHDRLFAGQELWSGQADPAEVFGQFAAELGLDTAVFETCLDSGTYTNAVQADVAEGMALGITGTPTFFIGGYGISGAQPIDLFQTVVEAIETDALEDLFREAYDAQVEALRAQRAAEAQQQPQPAAPTEPVDVPIEGWPTIGDPDAPVTIVEYTDFQCPYCGRYFAQTFPQIKENYIDTGLVRYVFKDFPLDFHLEADEAALAARCAHDQEAFMPMHDLLFERQGEWGGQSNVTEIFVGYADELGLDTAAFSECINSDKYVAAVQADLAEGFQVGVTGTPSFLVNGNLVVGALPYSSFSQAIESLLAQTE
ncbi:MAG: DsbA family protein, partial [Anaerolineales bacterium]|nr:DsbA family protein [Anaerolineales bacterium]